ncbi:interleukin-1 receptor-associated kinase 1 [Engraulis encrasicolus]|uniref:interleukin-1 receptor-associated kinase 1 n=1 Tax=Engraulis encrasicolus TaxID=184585 RepID=UPI002FD379F4
MLKNENMFIYDIPPNVMYEFTRVMDTLSQSDWIGFASHVVLDQTELRSIERCENRTDRLMNIWSCRNGTLADLLHVLEQLKMFRARDILIKGMHIVHPSPSQNPPSFPPPPLPHPPPPQPCHASLPSTWLYPVKESPATSTISLPDGRHLPLPCPPPAELMSQDERRPPTEPSSLKSEEDLYSSLSCAMCWPLEEIQRGTDNFSSARQIGEGGFGLVYRATMRNTDYAVKKLKEDSQLDWALVKQSFKTEVEKLSLYRHPNILDFAGYSIGDGTHCLLYVFMPNGSLEDRLQCQNSNGLSWSQRIHVLQGAAKAIQFLHACCPKVIHGDVKSSNILLGQHLEPKLGDFGLARLCKSPGRAAGGKTTTVAQTKTVQGTLAYLPDEYLKDHQLGVEIDIYSFGVVLLEVLTGRRALEVTDQSKAVYLKDLVAELEEDGGSLHTGKHSKAECISPAAHSICRSHLDSRVVAAGNAAPSGSLEIAQLACQCLHKRRKKRPPMSEVFKTLMSSCADQTYTCRSTVSLSSALPPPPPPKTPASADSSVEALQSEFTKLRPQEHTYYCSPHEPVSSLSSASSASTTLSSSSGLPPIDRSRDTRGMSPSSHRVPCESDESLGFSQYLSSSESSTSPKGSMPGTLRSEGDGDYSSCASWTGASQASSGAGPSSQEVVVNPAKQQMVQKMLFSSGLFSSRSGSYGDVSTSSQEPVESEESEY